jgi:hypothetical protein
MTIELKILILMKIIFFLLLALVAFQSCDNNDPNSTREYSRWDRFSGNPLILAGFDVEPGKVALSVSDPSVMYDRQDSTWKMWFATGWFEGDEFKTGVKYAESTDGADWVIHQALSLKGSKNDNDWDYTSVETPMVLKVPVDNNGFEYLMWYSGGNININPLGEDYPRFQIGMAISSNGVVFDKIDVTDSPYGIEGLVFKVEDAFPNLPGVATGVVADPAVVYNNGIFYMWFSSIGLTANDEDIDGGISHATSVDGINWEPSANNPIQSLKRMNEDFAAQPSVLYDENSGLYEMWFNADYPNELNEVGMNGSNGFWYATSMDGIEWTVKREKGRDFLFSSNLKYEKHGITVGCSVLQNDGNYHMFYGGLAGSSYNTGFENPWPYLHVINKAISACP